MRRFDSLYKKEELNVERTRSANQVTAAPPLPPQKNSFNMLYFYRSLRMVLGIWIILLFTVITYPWVDYFIKKKINSPQQVLGTQSQNLEQKAGLVTVNKNNATFSVEKKDLKINAPIVEGIGDEDFKKGIGHHPDSVWPNQKGNVVIAGHSFSLDAENPYAEVFSRLRELEIGDQVTVSYLGKKYIYEIFARETVSAKDVSLFGKSENWQLTFYTCDPPKTDWRRLVFQAELIKIE